MKKVLRWLEYPIHLLMWIGLICGTLMMLQVTADVTGRFFNHPLVGTNEIVSGYYMILIVYLPWAYITRNDNHVCADIFVRFIPPAVMVWLEVCIKMLTLVYVSVFAWQTFVRAIQQTRAGESIQVASGYLAIWPSRWALPLAGGLMAIYLVVRILDDIGETIRGEASIPKSDPMSGSAGGNL
jgi:TRAP-type C4-dicarboxylate transport system permease small subunit